MAENKMKAERELIAKTAEAEAEPTSGAPSHCR